MKKRIKVRVSKKKYFEVLGIIEKYAISTIEICSYERYNEIKFDCNKLRYKTFLRQIESVKDSLIKVEVEAK